ncbi:hypothetical protein OH807_11880 [Kitasatospora sp. NBC_01560]
MSATVPYDRQGRWPGRKLGATAPTKRHPTFPPPSIPPPTE